MRSKVVKRVDPATESKQSWMWGKGNAALVVILFNFLKSTHTLSFPFFFLTSTNGEVHGEVDGLMIPFSCNCIIASLSECGAWWLF